ncbi:peptidyl-tRNA hydrolase 2 [Cordyceps fumosorosea ARSEF 2679]|uniref:peptidyl-tRNA hydrolase n=1 Tax=Cordyceps fumosorosea (strain ARSEF 2679) TaxID=1081104 RepID=A0A168B4W1_CORFA|nr:peptidyl-tRNA hydrolase 2 [Cordyceps fumosorosea ARSEF 2679]OAA69621.1 peptidyl-tRNA hydrolase 2 [Cordyceps fumosorosea ARSEF 2679]
MAMDNTTVAITTALTTFVTGYIFGLYASRGYLFSPALQAERRANRDDPVESAESDVDEDDSLLDHAPNWSNGEAADVKQGLRFGASGTAAPKLKLTNEECKLVLVVRTDLGMTKGKIAAQCSHATLACYKALAAHPDPDSPERRMLARWERHGQAKIAVQLKSQEEMLQLCRKARGMGLTAEVIKDAGRTQIEAGSMTVLGVGPAPRSLVDEVTGHLKLL